MYSYIIIVPYRNREAQLQLFIQNVVPLFEKYLKSFKLVIVEQEEGKLFNRGKIINVGFNEYKDSALCFITHDIDIQPNEKAILEFYCNKNENNDINNGNNIIYINDCDTINNAIDIPSNTGSNSNNQKIVGIYTSDSNTLGGIIKFNKYIFNKINGYPNEYWGWGCEDKTLQNRAEFLGTNIHKNIRSNDNKKHEYFKIDDVGDRQPDSTFNIRTDFEYYKFNNLSHDEKHKNMLLSGLNNLEYKILERQNLNDNENIELIKVSI